MIFGEYYYKSKEKIFPLHTDPKMPYEHFMTVKWSWEVVKPGLGHFDLYLVFYGLLTRLLSPGQVRFIELV